MLELLLANRAMNLKNPGFGLQSVPAVLAALSFRFLSR